MGFTKFEKNEIIRMLRSDDETKNLVEKYLPDDVLEFLKNNKLFRQVRDYCIIPRIQKNNRPETLTVTFFLDTGNEIVEILEKWQEFISPPVFSTLNFKIK